MRKRFLFNLRFKTIGEVFARVSSLIYYAAAARFLGADSFGEFSLAMSMAAIVVIFVDLGMNNIVTRSLARDHDAGKILISPITTFKFIVLPFLFVIVQLILHFTGASGSLIRLTSLMLLVAFGTAMSEHQTAILTGLEKMDIEAWLKIAWRGGALIGAVAFVTLFKTVESFAVGSAVGLWISLLVGFLWIHKNISRLHFVWDPNCIRGVVRTSLPLFLGLICVIVYDNQDLIILSSMKFSPDKIGFFSGSAKLIDALRPFPVLLMGAVFPIASEAAVKDAALFKVLGRKIVFYSALFIVPAVAVCSLFSDVVCTLVYGKNFLGSAHVFSIAVWGFVGIFLNHVLTQFIIAADGQRYFLLSSVMTLLLNAALCMFFFRQWGIVGGAWALVATETLTVVINAALLKHLVHHQVRFQRNAA